MVGGMLPEKHYISDNLELSASWPFRWLSQNWQSCRQNARELALLYPYLERSLVLSYSPFVMYRCEIITFVNAHSSVICCFLLGFFFRIMQKKRGFFFTFLYFTASNLSFRSEEEKNCAVCILDGKCALLIMSYIFWECLIHHMNFLGANI